MTAPAHHIALHDVVFGGTARSLERLTELPVVVSLNIASAHGTP